MKTKTLLFALFATIAFSASAQSDESLYLVHAWENIYSGNCDAAQRNYNIYKEISESTNNAIEVAIADCKKNHSKELSQKSYKVGDDAMDLISERGYIIAYLDDSGKHGIAIKIWISSISNTSTEASLQELKIISKNKNVLGLIGEYWSTTPKETLKYYTYDFSTGKTRVRKIYDDGQFMTIKVRRF